MAISKRLRYEILRRDNHACRYCGKVAPVVELRVDHVVPVTLGGSDDPSNLVAACRDCNAGKSSVPVGADLVADVEQDAMRWANAMKLAQARALAERDAQIKVEKAVWDHLEQYGRYIPGNWFDSITQFLAAGLDPVEITDAAMTADGAGRIPWEDKWRYFCGICWKKVARRREAAAAIIAEQEGAEPEHEPTGEEQQAYSDGWEMGHARALHEHNVEIGLYYALSRVCDGAILTEVGL